jgi:hypothetical protein
MKPILAAKHSGMRVSAEGVLGRIRDGSSLCRGDEQADGTRYMVGEMLKHLFEVAERYYAGDMAVVDEFLQLYCLDDDRPKEGTE